MTAEDAPDALDRLADATNPHLIGVRHHSPAIAAAIVRMLDSSAPTLLLVELPTELQRWLEWLSHPELETPVALGAARSDGRGLAFYPFADFSPELAAIRWARANNVPVEAFDLPVGAKHWEEIGEERVQLPELTETGDLIPQLLKEHNCRDVDDLWDRLVEAHAPGCTPEQVRRAALAIGWALRHDAETAHNVRESDLRREQWMRQHLGSALARAARVTVVVGSFHAPALISTLPSEPASDELADVVTSLVPYDFELLDSRSGYPAGIRDPRWQQQVYESGGDPDSISDATAATITAVTTELRRLGHPAGVPDAREATRVAGDLARLRNQRAPARRELVEALQTSLVQGELLGRGRVVARAMDAALVGRRRGRLAPGTPRSGLAHDVERILEELRLPGIDAAAEAVDIRLDPLRSPLDHQRHVTLRRLEACRIPYGRLLSGSGAAPEALTFRWSLRWEPATSALLELASVNGVTLEQAAEGLLRRQCRETIEQSGEVTATLMLLEGAAECSYYNLANEALADIRSQAPASGTLAEDLAALDLVERAGSGLIPGLRPTAELTTEAEQIALEILEAALRAVDGLAGSDEPADARALASLVHRLVDANDQQRVRLGWSLDSIALSGGALMQGAAEIARLLLGRTSAAQAAALLGSWIDEATTSEAQNVMSRRLSGALVTAGPIIESSLEVLDGLIQRVDTIDDDSFFRRLPALRSGFEVLSPAARERFLVSVLDRLGIDARGHTTLEDDPGRLASWAHADLVGRRAVEAFDAAQLIERDPGARSTSPPPALPGVHHQLAPADRWRLILGCQRDELPPTARRAADTLDELYGQGRGEGSRSVGGGGGSEASFPSVREWSEELEALFGTRVRDEVLARAAEQGRIDAALALNPEAVRPSIELLEQVLSLKGGLGEGNLRRLRVLVTGIVDDLVRQLSTRTRPALVGAVSNRRTRRPTGVLDLATTIKANLHTARAGDGGTIRITPEQLWFRTKTRRSLDWRVVLVVDVSGSMEASVIYAALMSAIVNALPAVTAHFVAFSTEVVDLSDRVDDPLSLLLEVSVGGGTHIAKGLRYARTLVTVPTRTIVVLITDFEEGGPVGELLAEVRALAESGVKPIGLAALDDQGAPRYSVATAELVVNAGMPVAALSPLELARWIGEQIR
ncbi:MAG TPA: DUF5682 family protein [Acidimicrobiales bacterium]|nr:DUF5682 family protein [Acidimicrobiales bacterium]